MMGLGSSRSARTGAAVLCALAMVPPWTVAQVPEMQTCLREDYARPVIPAFGNQAPAPYAPDEKSCWLDVQHARAEDWMPLDVRDSATSTRVGLPGVTALPLAAVADRRYLLEQPLLLIGSGVDLRALTKACLQLRAQGFARVRTLLGGARSWARKSDDDFLGPHEFWLGALDGQWRIVSVGLRADQAAELPISPEVSLPVPTDEDALQKALATVERAKPSEPHHQWLVVAGDEAMQQAAQARWKGTRRGQGTQPLAWLTGGWTAYRAYLNQQQQSAAHAGRALPRICGF